MEGLPNNLLLNFFWLQNKRDKVTQREHLKIHPVDGDAQGAKCLQAGNELTIWYQFPQKIKLMRKNKREIYGEVDKALL